ncbi:putative GTP-binding protein EngB [Polaromonas vacuolata]|uniref:Probable GTP-binding protein EngB n=1 Tax=Polaromonas vacuolata TaxID=37448 RepID=A0A6H2HCU1_9BURK|nr:ribosome biogenesis GTP-binding protein YihA/YsxC [Polaromonas vacuolata]QJC57613.1 putative GTP-binding protein EngB [Polaromonas vacuolata]
MTSPSTSNNPAKPTTSKRNPKVALGWLHTAKFLTTAPELKFLPRLDVPEIAFVGRSNAGKSTCINTLTQQHRLAYASKTPGRTQSINLFTLGKQGVTDAVLTDLPGYGYAAVPKEAKYRWQKVMGNYLQTRDNLKAIVLMCDPRLGLTELDEILLDVIRPRVVEGLKFLVLLTKSDKLNKTEAAKALSIVRLQAGGGDVKLFSSLKRQGVDEVAIHLWDWAHPQDKAVKKPKTGLIELGQNAHEEDEPENLDEQEIQDELPALDEQNDDQMDDRDPLDPNSQLRG